MTDILTMLDNRGIRLRDTRPGDHRTTCPNCSAGRKKKTDPCLSVTVDPSGADAVWNCWHCEWHGGTKERTYAPYERKSRNWKRPTFKPVDDPDNKLLMWFEKRGISPEVVKRNRIEPSRVWMQGADKKVWCIAYPYFRDDELINVKYRDTAKRFRQEKNAEKIFYGLDDIIGADEVIIVEGENDKLAFEQAGRRRCVSVPDGAPKEARDAPIDKENDAKFEYVWNCWKYFEGVKKIILATDGDGPGRALAEELSRRFGRERCWRVHWPSIGDVVHKDANEVLLEDGAQVLRECAEHAEPWPIKSLFSVATFSDEVFELFESGPERLLSTGWSELDPFYKLREGDLTVVTGLPGAGKSEFFDALAMNLAKNHDWKFALCSFENTPTEHIAKLLEKHVEAPFFEGPVRRMEREEVQPGLDWLNERFFFLRADDETPSFEWILETARMAVARHGIRGLIIDPYNEIEHKRPPGMTETEYVSQMLSKVKRFAVNAGVHVWFVAHPTKIRRDRNGILPNPSLHDISGSANWSNKADIGVVVHRDYTAEDTGPKGETEVKIVKARAKAVGRPGGVVFNYDRATGLYSVKPPKK
jgi:twinkle protein